MKPQSTKFLIARHGETLWNQERRLQGILDSPLSEKGLLQAQQLAEEVVSIKPDLIFSSPLGRAKTTANHCSRALSIPVCIVDDLIERDFGSFQGQKFDNFHHLDNFSLLFEQVTCHAPPNGESGLNCQSRISKALKRLAIQYAGKKLLIITHGDAIRCFLDGVVNNTISDAYSQYANGKVHPIIYNHVSDNFEPCISSK